MTSKPRVTILPSPDAIGAQLAPRLLDAIENARDANQRFLLGCPTGRTPAPILAEIVQRVALSKQDLSHVVLVMMDEYLVQGDDGLRFAPFDAAWSCHNYIARWRTSLDGVLPAPHRLAKVWFPDPADPGAYDARIADAGGIDWFLLASGASDGHVAFNPPGSQRDSRTRIIELSDETRRDNLQTFPSFGTLDAVPHHGISVGIATITASRAATMVVWGAGKRETFRRIVAAKGYDPSWPATLIHACANGEILADSAAAANG